MELVADSDREDAESRVRSALQSLAGNLLRVISGGGHPYDLHEQAAQFVKVIEAYRASYRMQPNIPAFLRYEFLEDDEQREWRRTLSHGRQMQHRAEDKIIIAALRWAALEFIGGGGYESAHRTKVHSDLQDGIEQYGEARQEQRREDVAEERRRRERYETEPLIRLGPAPNWHPQLFSAEYSWQKTRDPDDLKRTEEVLSRLMGFHRQEDDRVVSYVYRRGSKIVYADPREQGKIEFKVYGGRHIANFTLYDKWKDLPGKFRKRLLALESIQ